MDSSYSSSPAGAGLFQPRLLEDAVYCFRVEVTFLFAHGDRDLARFRRVDVVIVITFGIFIFPPISKDDAFHFFRRQSITSLQLYYTHDAYKCQAGLQ